MQVWQVASNAEKRQFEVISMITEQSKYLLRFLFDPSQPKLKAPPDTLLRQAKGFASNDYLLVKLCLDLWCEHGQISVHELFNLEPEVFKRVLQALDSAV